VALPHPLSGRSEIAVVLAGPLLCSALALQVEEVQEDPRDQGRQEAHREAERWGAVEEVAPTMAASAGPVHPAPAQQVVRIPQEAVQGPAVLRAPREALGQPAVVAVEEVQALQAPRVTEEPAAPALNGIQRTEPAAVVEPAAQQ
jgi:hypothetical protein